MRQPFPTFGFSPHVGSSAPRQRPKINVMTIPPMPREDFASSTMTRHGERVDRTLVGTRGCRAPEASERSPALNSVAVGSGLAFSTSSVVRSMGEVTGGVEVLGCSARSYFRSCFRSRTSRRATRSTARKMIPNMNGAYQPKCQYSAPPTGGACAGSVISPKNQYGNRTTVVPIDTPDMAKPI